MVGEIGRRLWPLAERGLLRVLAKPDRKADANPKREAGGRVHNPTIGGGNVLPMTEAYHEGSRELQDRFDTRRLADRLHERFRHSDAIGAEDRAFIERMDMFFLATADAGGRPECSYKGGDPGFVKVLDAHTLAFPNCPRYIHKMHLLETSVFAPRPGHVPPVPDWKRMDVFRDYLPGTTPPGPT